MIKYLFFCDNSLEELSSALYRKEMVMLKQLNRQILLYVKKISYLFSCQYFHATLLYCNNTHLLINNKLGHNIYLSIFLFIYDFCYFHM